MLSLFVVLNAVHLTYGSKLNLLSIVSFNFGHSQCKSFMLENNLVSSGSIPEIALYKCCLIYKYKPLDLHIHKYKSSVIKHKINCCCELFMNHMSDLL